ncbi:Hypothetical_protein [Hexamita inflata]|uniref:Hypothetical_protein n=1 Tax=Hexamita inflata TaxID=28002 RepID=A0AA86PMA6_9EUKA|nr:Hypothetical protein HINF_LOCUS6062 [Hexamita inflata]CAI9942750.1 Hypothetical protein HINF_LOCUS30395 [Hexamita inflata]
MPVKGYKANQQCQQRLNMIHNSWLTTYKQYLQLLQYCYILHLVKINFSVVIYKLFYFPICLDSLVQQVALNYLGLPNHMIAMIIQQVQSSIKVQLCQFLNFNLDIVLLSQQLVIIGMCVYCQNSRE